MNGRIPGSDRKARPRETKPIENETKPRESETAEADEKSLPIDLSPTGEYQTLDELLDNPNALGHYEF